MAGEETYAVIIAGGQGTRFWPKSRQKRPKQLLNIVGDGSLIQQTKVRIEKLIPQENILIVTGTQYGMQIREHIPGIKHDHILEEPRGRNTAAALCLASIHLLTYSKDATMIALPADHCITQEARFIHHLEMARYFARKNKCLVTLGITPTHPETGYGYIMKGGKVSGAQKEAFWVNKFTEKPGHEDAKKFVESDNYLWNSGMFIWEVTTFWQKVQELMPDYYQWFDSLKQRIGTPSYNEFLDKVYYNIGSISVDVGIMERAEQVIVIPVDIGWNDVGSWTALDQLSEHDKDGNSARATHMLIDTHNTLIDSADKEKLVAMIGIDDLIVVDTKDVLLLCHKNRAQDIRKIVQDLETRELREYL
ncbi:MAG: mannose-1-phosphate guanylyltransferase [bacterium]